MSVWASGSIHMKAKETIPEELITAMKECDTRVSNIGRDYCIEFDGKWYLEDLIDTIAVFNPYINYGVLAYSCEDGSARANFTGDRWEVEFEQRYFPSELPEICVSSTGRVGKILNTIAEQLMDGSDSGEAVRILLGECKLTDQEVKLYNLGWLKDLA